MRVILIACGEILDDVNADGICATADKLMELSTKAQENGYQYALGQAQRAAEKVVEKPRRRF